MCSPNLQALHILIKHRYFSPFQTEDKSTCKYCNIPLFMYHNFVRIMPLDTKIS